MAASRMNATFDGPSLRLVKITNAVVLAGERVLPKTTARSALDLSKAVRFALEAGEVPMAEKFLGEIATLLDGLDNEYATTILTRVGEIQGSITQRRQFESRNRVG